MSRLFYHVMQDNLGNLLFDVSGTMRLAGTGTLATIYGDEALTVPIANPMTNHPSFGSFKCFLGAGDYDFYMAKGGYTFETLTGVQGHGTMAQQDAHDVAISGGTIVGLSALTTTGPVGLGRAIDVGYGLSVQGAIQTAASLNVGTESTLTGAVGISRAPDPTYSLSTAGGVQVGTGLTVLGAVGIGSAPVATFKQAITYDKASETALRILPTGSDAGGGLALQFLNVAAAMVGSITTAGAATAYNTTSDARLKHAVQTLVGELAVIRALRPVRFRWNADDSEGVGFLAGEVAEHVQGVITGEPDAVEADGVTIRPQQIDHSKLVPWLVGAVQTLAARVETLTERVAELEAH